MAQVVARLDEWLIVELDGLVERGTFDSRSQAVRVALEQLIDRERRAEIGRQIVAGYERTPQTREEIADATAMTIAMIDEEPW